MYQTLDCAYSQRTKNLWKANVYMVLYGFYIKNDELLIWEAFLKHLGIMPI